MAQGGLVHFMQELEFVVSILTNGFLYVPNRRYLIEKLLEMGDFREREPQEFGMISLTDTRQVNPRDHRARFGSFGVAVTWEWAVKSKAQRVMYISTDGPVFLALRWMFLYGRQELLNEARRRNDEAGVAMALANKSMAAGMGAELYAHLLTLYEYMEPEENSAQAEWRIVNPTPFYQDRGDKHDVVAHTLDTAKKWRNIAGLRLAPQDVTALFAPADQIERLRAAIPTEFQGVAIEPTPEDWIASTASPAGSAKREIPLEPLPAQEGLPWPRIPGVGIPDVPHLPMMDETGSLQVFASKVSTEGLVVPRMRSIYGKLYDLPLRTTAARQLLGWLATAAEDTGGFTGPYNPPEPP